MQLTLVGVSRCLLRQFYCLHPFTTMHACVPLCVCWLCVIVYTERLPLRGDETLKVFCGVGHCVVYTVAHTESVFSVLHGMSVTFCVYVFVCVCVVL